MDLIKEINDKYSALEAEVDKKLEKVKRDEEKLEKLCKNAKEKSPKVQSPKILTYEEALTRNANLLKSLEMAKARLRSRSTYTPIEQILEKAIENYKRDLRTTSSQESRMLEQTEQIPIKIATNQTNENDHLYEAIEKRYMC